MTNAIGTTAPAVRDDMGGFLEEASPIQPGLVDLRFEDFLDVINPLQHLPVVSTLYRALSGDEISPGARFAGGLLYGGPIGAVATGLTSLVEEALGGGLTSSLSSSTGPNTGPRTAASALPGKAGRETYNSEALRSLARDLRNLTLYSRNMPQPPDIDPVQNSAKRENGAAYAAWPADASSNRPRHPNLPPSGASGAWYAEAMQRALQKYGNAASLATSGNSIWSNR